MLHVWNFPLKKTETVFISILERVVKYRPRYIGTVISDLLRMTIVYSCSQEVLAQEVDDFLVIGPGQGQGFIFTDITSFGHAFGNKFRFSE